MKKIAKIFALSALVLLVAAPVAFGQVGTPPSSVPGEVYATNLDIYTIINNIIRIAFVVLMLAAVLFIILAAFKYLTAQGDSEKVETARSMLLYAVIAIVIGLVARSVPWIIANFISGSVVR